MSDTKNFALLKSLGFEDSDQWMLYDKSSKDFFEWFSNNITSDNILTDLELKEYNDLKRDGALLEGEDLANAMAALNEQYPNIMELTDEDVKEQEKKLEELLLIEESYEAVTIDMKATRLHIVKEITDLEAQIIDAKYLEEKHYQQSLDHCAELSELQSINQQLYVELNQCYTKPQTPPLFVYQMPLEQYNTKCEQFLKYFEIYMRQNFDIKDFLESETEAEIKGGHIKRLECLKEKLFTADKKLNEECMNIKGTSKILQTFSEYNFDDRMTVATLKKMTAELENNNKLTEIQMHALKQDLQVYLRQLSDLEIENVLHENNKLKLVRAKERLNNARELTGIVSDAIANAEIMWTLMQFDLEKLKNKFDNTDQIQKEAIECSKRIEQLKRLPKSSLEMAKDYFVEEFATTLAAHLQKPVENFGYLKACFEEYKIFNEDVESRLANVVDKKYYESVYEIFNEISDTEKFLIAYLYNGPVNKPQFFDPKFIQKIFEANKYNETLAKAIKKFKDDYNKNVVDIDKFQQYQALLWIWFLTEPKRVLMAIKEVTAAAANTQSAAFKNISGIMRKH